MIEQVPLRQLSSSYDVQDLYPQAIVEEPISYFSSRLKFEEAADDLDEFLGAAFVINEKYVGALKHYRGRPRDETTIYLPSTITGLAEITAIIRVILEELNINVGALKWERQMNPEL